MLGFIKQAYAITAMNLRSIPRRLSISLAAVGAIMLVVLVMLGSLALDRGLSEIAEKTGNRNVAVLLREGATSEINSQIGLEQIQLIKAAPFLDGAVVSPEVVVAINAQDKTSREDASLTFRGVEFMQATSLRPDLRIIEGRQPSPGSNEVMVGRRVHDSFVGFDIGSERRMSEGTFKIVGIFEAGGSISESEIWGDVTAVQSLFGRGSAVQSVRVWLSKADSFANLGQYNRQEERLGLDLQNENEFLKSQAEGVTDLITLIGQPLALVMALGALIGAANAMSVSVADRGSEISTLRTLGFSRSATFVGTLAESMTLALIGAALGIIASFAIFQGFEASTVSGGFSKVVFDLSLGADLVLQALAYALLIGLLGSMLPAWKAARRPILEGR